MASRNRPMSRHTAAVLHALSRGVSYGFDIMDATGLPSGTVYPILARLEARGLVESEWEEPAAHREEGRPARRYYRITAVGRSALVTELERFRAAGHPVPGLA